MYVLVHCLTTRFANRKSRFCLILPPSLADMHTLYSKTRAPHLRILPIRFHCFGRCAVTGGLRCALHCSTSPAKCVNLGQTSQAEAKIVVPEERTEDEPSAYSAEVRVVVPAAAATNTVRTRRTTLRIGNNIALHISSIV